MAKVAFDEIGAVTATFLTTGALEKGDVVEVTGEKTVGACTDGGRFCGAAVDVASDGVAAVQVGGFLRVKVSGEGVAPGRVSLVADGDGGVRKASAGTAGSDGASSGGETGQEHLVVSVSGGTAVIWM